MKRFFLLFLALAVLSSCAPQAYSLLYDMHYPGEAGFVLENKTMSVVYLNDGKRQDTTYVNSLATGWTLRRVLTLVLTLVDCFSTSLTFCRMLAIVLTLVDSFTAGLASGMPATIWTIIHILATITAIETLLGISRHC